MMFLMALRLALRSLLRNRMRSALTALGVIIGVAALLVTVVLGEGTRKMVAAQIATMGSAILMIVPGPPHKVVSWAEPAVADLSNAMTSKPFCRRERFVMPYRSIAQWPRW
jgi:putative ABC transport system permease protein